MSTYSDIARDMIAGDHITSIEEALVTAAERGHREGEQYQGWANRETWALMLHVNNDEGLYGEFRDIVRPDGDAEQWALEGAVKDLAESCFTPDGYFDTFGDVIQNNSASYMAMQEIGSLWRVDWAEVTAALLED